MRAFVVFAFGLAIMAAPAVAADGNGIRRVEASSSASFSAMTEVNGVLYLSGQIGRGPDGMMSLDWKVQTSQAMDNISAMLKSQGLSMDDVFKCTVMLTDMRNFAEFNEIYKSYFKPGMLPARSAFGAAALAAGAAVEIECMAKAK